MPQLDVSTFVPQLFWVGLCFLLLYVLLGKLYLPKIASVLHLRQKHINEHLNKASLYREEAENLLREYEEGLALARKQSQEKSRAAIQDINEKIAHKKQLYLEKTMTFQHAEEQKLYRAYRDAKAQLSPLVEEISSLILTKLVSPSSTKKKSPSR